MAMIPPFRFNIQSQRTTSTDLLTSHSPSVNIFPKFGSSPSLIFNVRCIIQLYYWYDNFTDGKSIYSTVSQFCIQQYLVTQPILYTIIFVIFKNGQLIQGRLRQGPARTCFFFNTPRRCALAQNSLKFFEILSYHHDNGNV
jgi:hypothetical protein